MIDFGTSLSILIGFLLFGVIPGIFIVLAPKLLESEKYTYCKRSNSLNDWPSLRDNPIDWFKGMK